VVYAGLELRVRIDVGAFDLLLRDGVDADGPDLAEAVSVAARPAFEAIVESHG
jgi:hypothetical protein